jgi:hypothetical protein
MRKKTYRLLRQMPQHAMGEILYKPDQNTDHYLWQDCNSPEANYPVSSLLVESDTLYFKEVYAEWETGQTIYFIGFDGVVLDEDFHPARHGKLVEYGNAYMNRIDAEQQSAAIGKLHQSFNSKQ